MHIGGEAEVEANKNEKMQEIPHFNSSFAQSSPIYREKIHHRYNKGLIINESRGNCNFEEVTKNACVPATWFVVFLFVFLNTYQWFNFCQFSLLITHK